MTSDKSTTKSESTPKAVGPPSEGGSKLEGTRLPTIPEAKNRSRSLVPTGITGTASSERKRQSRIKALGLDLLAFYTVGSGSFGTGNVADAISPKLTRPDGESERVA
jgi:hypothetical protein